MDETKTMTDHPDFWPMPHPAHEALAAHLYTRHREHEAEVANWMDGSFDVWTEVEPDIQRSYRAMARAAKEFLA